MLQHIISSQNEKKSSLLTVMVGAGQEKNSRDAAAPFASTGKESDSPYLAEWTLKGAGVTGASCRARPLAGGENISFTGSRLLYLLLCLEMCGGCGRHVQMWRHAHTSRTTCKKSSSETGFSDTFFGAKKVRVISGFEYSYQKTKHFL